MIVLDASVAFELLSQTKAGLAAEALLANETLHAPHLLDAEIAHLLRRQVRFGLISSFRGKQLLDSLRALRLTRHEHFPLLDRMWSLRDNLTAYDACYIALAERLDATFVTRDAAFSSVRLMAGRVQVL
jgi:predicted nucleic acid-binding protein